MPSYIQLGIALSLFVYNLLHYWYFALIHPDSVTALLSHTHTRVSRHMTTVVTWTQWALFMSQTQRCARHTSQTHSIYMHTHTVAHTYITSVARVYSHTHIAQELHYNIGTNTHDTPWQHPLLHEYAVLTKLSRNNNTNNPITGVQNIRPWVDLNHQPFG